MDLNKDYYNILGIEKTATEKDIKKVFRKKANETHPDKKNGDDKEFKIINDAYQILNDKNKKSEYDKKSKFGKDYKPFTFFSSKLDNFDFFTKNRKSDFHEELDITVNVDINLNQSYKNESIDIKYNRFVKCTDCNGNGFDKNSESYECEICDGKGDVWEPVTGNKKCKYCMGSGKINSGICKKCNGLKVIQIEEDFKLNNIFNIKKDEIKYIKNKGHQSRYYRSKVGDLIIKIKFIDDDRYDRKQDGLYYKINIHYEDAIKGSDIEYTHLDGKKYKLKIPPKTEDGDQLKMANKGMLLNSNLRQHLIFIINIFIDYSRLE